MTQVNKSTLAEVYSDFPDNVAVDDSLRESDWLWLFQIGYDKQGLPIGLQLIGRPWCEASILCLAYAIEVHEETNLEYLLYSLLDFWMGNNQLVHYSISVLSLRRSPPSSMTS